MNKLSTHRDPLIRSFLSEKRLITSRDVEALWHKYHTPAFYRLQDLFYDGIQEEEDDSAVTIREQESPISGKSNRHEIEFGESVFGLHVDRHGGLATVRSELAAAARYVGQQACKPEFVLGVTFTELARVAVRLGFEKMEIIDFDEDYYYDVATRHRAFSAVNPMRNVHPFEMSAVYLPAEEFVAKFDVNSVGSRVPATQQG